MRCVFGFAIGESFAELSGYSADLQGGSRDAFFKSRWYLPKKSLADGLREALNSSAQAAPGHIRFATDSVERMLNRGQGRPPAVIVTSGFETWLSLRQPVVSPPYSIRGERRRLPCESDFIFGMTERTTHDGVIQTKVSVEDLEFLAAKFELLKVRDVAVLFAHSDTNPENERSVASYLRDRGLRVLPSHLISGGSLEERWRRTIENAFAEGTLLEEKAQIDAVLAQFPGWTAELVSKEGLEPFSEYTARKVRGGLRSLLTKTHSRGLMEGSVHLHCGLDEVSVYGIGGSRTCLKPTVLVKHGMWPFPHLAKEAAGYEPGPMLFGKSQQLAALDVLFVRDRLKDVDGLSALLNDKARPRILGTLFTLAKNIADKRRVPDADAIAADLERAFVEEMAVAIAAEGAKASVQVSGPLASSLTPLLSERRSDLKFSFNEGDAFAESRATALECM